MSSQKGREISRGQGRGAAEGLALHLLQHLRKFCFVIAARPITLRGQGAAWLTQQGIQKYGYSNRN